VFEELQDSAQVSKMAEAILHFHEQTKDLILYPSYVLDVVVLDDFKVLLIECNPFGAWMSSGSALFDWDKDYDILYGNTSTTVHIRVLKELVHL
jgi:hypothetical protein